MSRVPMYAPSAVIISQRPRLKARVSKPPPAAKALWGGRRALRGRQTAARRGQTAAGDATHRGLRLLAARQLSWSGHSHVAASLRIGNWVCRFCFGGVPGRACAALGCWADASSRMPAMILSKVRDSRFVTIRRGGTLTDSDHQLLALWAASCAEHVLDFFELARPGDPRPRQAIEHARAWVRGEVKMTQARTAAGHAMAAARDLRGAARHAAYAAGQAGAVAHVAAHELGAAAYAIKAARAGAPEGEGEGAGRLECRWQRDQLPEAIRELVLDDQRLRNDICWSVFDC
jgi:Imm-5 like putative immunity protein